MIVSTSVPFVDLRTQYRNLKAEIDEAVGRVLDRCDYILGGAVKEFEQAFASFVGAKRAIGVGSGTDALHLILRGLDIGPGDEVITVTNTFIATVEAITLAGASPVLVDCREDDYLIDPDAVEQVVTSRTRAIIPVHLYGQPADMDAVAGIADAHDLVIIEDAAQSHGATMSDDRPCGSIGRAAGFSFYPSKNLGACGDGGMITTNDEELAERLALLRNWGSVVKYQHEVKGFNSRLDTMQAAILSVKLKHLDDFNEGRARAAGWYRVRLEAVSGVILPPRAPWTGRHVYHLFVVRVPGCDQNGLIDKLKADGVQAGIHYPIPVHLQPAYADLGLTEGAFRVSEKASREIISLPMYPEITEGQVDHVVESLRRCL